MWYCESCGARYSVEFKDGRMYIGKTNECKRKKLVVLRSGNIVLIVEGTTLSCMRDNNDEYFYNYHTCSINYIHDVKMVIDVDRNNNDPHRIFKYIGTFDYDERILEPNCSMDVVRDIVLFE